MLGCLLAAAGCKSNSVTAVAASCPEGFVDCNSDPSDGCEVNTTADPKNCGACGNTCSANGGAAQCVSSQCSTQCAPGFADCNRDPSDGCEISIANDSKNCGACGTTCSGSNSEETCSGGRCTVAKCTGTFADCDGNAANGCEVDTASALDNCGICGNACAKVTSGTVTCASSKCALECATSFTECSGACVDLQNDSNNCGTCGNSCGTAPCHYGKCDERLAKDLNFPRLVAAGSSYVFFTDQANTTIYALPKDVKDGVATTFLDKLTSIDAMSALDSKLYFEVGSELFVVNDDATGKTKIASGVSPGLWAINNGRLYYANNVSGSTTLYTSNLDGTGVLPAGAASSGSTTLIGAAGCAMFVESGTASQTLYNVPLTGGLQLNVATNAKTGNLGLGGDAEYAYFNDAAGWKRVLRGGGSATAMSTTPNVYLQKFETDRTSNYVLVTTGKVVNGKPVYDLLRFDVSSTATSLLFSGAADFDIGGSWLYVTDAANGAVRRIAKPGTAGGGTSLTETCTCKTGYGGDGKFCRSCSFNNGGCSSNATCSTPSGVLTCTCNSGYVGDGVTCASACSVSNGGCDPNAVCANGTSGVTCTCKTANGWSGDGKTCTYNPCTDTAKYGANGGCGGGNATIATCADGGGVPLCTCKAPYQSSTSVAGGGCYLYNPFSATVSTTLNVGPCTVTTPAHPSVTFTGGTWTMSQSGLSSSSAGTATLSWNYCTPAYGGNNLSMSGAPTRNGPVTMTGSSGTCTLLDSSGGKYVITSVTSLKVYPHSIGQSIFDIAGSKGLQWTPPGGPTYTCDLELYASPF